MNGDVFENFVRKKLVIIAYYNKDFDLACKRADYLIEKKYW
jgi:hypothetical protein